MKQKKKIFTIFSVLLTSIIIFIPTFNKVNIAEAAKSNFYIKKGVLLGYSGTDKNITIPRSVKVIGKEAFYQKNIKSVIIPDTVNKIGIRAFCCCTELESVKLSKSLTSISYSAFGSCTSLKSIIIPKNVKTINNFAFMYCRKLKQIKIMNKNIYIGSEVFTDTAWLKNCKDKFVVINGNLIKYKGDDPIITVPDNVRVICGEAFNRLEGLEKITLPTSVEIIGENAFYLCEELRKVKMTNSVTNICDYAFNQCYSLEDITLSENLIKIGEAAFFDSGLNNITIPKSVKSIGEDAFGDCEYLEEVNLPETLTNIATDAFLWAPWIDNLIEKSESDYVIVNTKLFAYKGKSTSVNVPYGVTAIMADAFYKSSIKEISMPDSVIEVGYSAFMSCNKLETIKFSDKTKRIEMYAFKYCSRLKTLKLPKNLTYIGTLAFEFCSNLKNVSISKNADISYYNDPFYGCIKLSLVKCNGNIDAYYYIKAFVKDWDIKCKIER